MAQDRESEIPLSTLDTTDIGPVNVSSTRKVFLCPAHQFALFADAHAKLFKHVIFHARMFINYGL